MEWFSGVVELLASGNTLSSQSKSIENLIGSNKKIWDENELKESLKKLISPELVTKNIFDFYFSQCKNI